MLNEQQQAFKRVLNLMHEAGCLLHVVLVGSWAEFVYRETSLLEGFSPNIRTLDVDFLVRNMRRPVPAVKLTLLARKRGFFVDSDVMNGTTKLLDTSGLEVEFLIGKMGAGAESVLKTNVGVTAQALRHMDILSSNSTEVLCLGYVVRVPLPEAYAVHKMVINTQRGSKQEKDARAIEAIWPFLDYQRLKSVLAKLTKRERTRADAFMVAHGLEISE